MRIAVSGEIPGREYDLNEIATYIRNYGADAIELWPENIPGSECAVHRLYRDRDVVKAERILQKKGVEVACVAFGAGFDRSLSEDKSLFSQELCRAVEVAAMLGAKYVNHYLYYMSMDAKANIDRLKRILTPAIERAETLGVILVLENEAHDSTRDPAEMQHIVHSMGSKHYRTNFDAINYYQASFEGFPYAYNLLKTDIAYVHIKDGCIWHPEFGHGAQSLGGEMTGANRGSRIFYPALGTGALNITGLLQALHENGYNGWCTIEPHTTTELWHTYAKAEIKYLRETGYFV